MNMPPRKGVSVWCGLAAGGDILGVSVGKLRYENEGSNIFWDMALSISDAKPACCEAVLFLREEDELEDEEEEEAVLRF